MSAPPLSMFRKSMLQAYEFRGTDAAVIFVPEGAAPRSEVQGVLTRFGQQRWYPVPGGHRAKVPWACTEGHEALFEREENGWDHEHCDFCNAHIRIADIYWTTDSEGGGFWAFCGDCYDKLEDE